MRPTQWGCWVVLAWLSLPALQAAGLPDTVARVKGSIVGVGTVLMTRRPPGNFVGTGFIVGDGRHLVTNAHVLPKSLDEQRREYLALLSSDQRRPMRRVRVVETDDWHDLALLKIEEGPPLPALRLANGHDVREGESVAFTGFPIGMVLGMRPVTHRGIISSISPVALPQLSSKQLTNEMIRRLKNPYDVYQLDATAYPGNSGSPLYDPDTGGVIGVINKVFIKESRENLLEKPSGITYAIPVRHVLALLQRAGIHP